MSYTTVLLWELERVPATTEFLYVCGFHEIYYGSAVGIRKSSNTNSVSLYVYGFHDNATCSVIVEFVASALTYMGILQ